MDERRPREERKHEERVRQLMNDCIRRSTAALQESSLDRKDVSPEEKALYNRPRNRGFCAGAVGAAVSYGLVRHYKVRGGPRFVIPLIGAVFSNYVGLGVSMSYTIPQLLALDGGKAAAQGSVVISQLRPCLYDEDCRKLFFAEKTSMAKYMSELNDICEKREQREGLVGPPGETNPLFETPDFVPDDAPPFKEPRW